MKLRKLVVQGYKTFASRTEFVFEGGITAIVGPNGSGKSNVADALRWVLGEQNPSVLRAKRTSDMIFAGSAGRARAGLAQVIITLDNSDGWLPIDYTEVEIGRRAFRSGENEYLLNGQQVRLKDIADLLATSGLAERTYTIIGQGLVDQALSLRSDERRALFEEAAGITHYKARRAETLRRLEETQRNLQRVYDILAELRPRLTSLKRQATRTQNYDQISTDLHALLRVWYGYRWEQAKVDMRQARQSAAAAEEAWEASRVAVQAVQSAIDALQSRMNAAQQQIADRQPARDRLRESLAQALREQAILGERRTLLQRQSAELESEVPELTRQQAAAQADLSAAAAELAAAQEQLQEQHAAWQGFRQGTAALQAEISRCQSATRAAEEERRRQQNLLSQLEGQLAQLRERRVELDAPQPGDDPAAELAALEARLPELETELARLQAETGAARDERAAAQRRRQEQISALDRARRALREQEAALNRRRNELGRLEERVAMLARSRGQSLALEPNRILGQVAGLLTIPPEIEPALAAALGERLALWLVPDTADLWRAVSQSRGRKSDSDAGLLLAALADLAARDASERPPVPAGDGIIGWASDLVRSEPQAAPLVEHLLGSILIVRDAETAYRLARTWPRGYAAATPDGFVAYAGGLVESRAAAGDRGILARETAWRKERGRLDEMTAAIAAEELALKNARAEIDALQAAVEREQGDENRARQAENDAAARASAAERRLESARQQRQFLARQRQAQEQARAQIETRLAQVMAQIEAHREALARAEAAAADAAAQLAALPVGETAQQQQVFQQSMATAQTILAGRQAVVDSRRATLNQVDGQLGRVNQRLALLRNEFVLLEERAAQEAVEPLQAELEALDAIIGPLRATIDADRAALVARQQEMAPLQRHAHDLETQLTQARIKLAHQQNYIEGLQERIRADLGLVSLSYDAEQSGALPLPMADVVEELPAVAELPPDIEETIQSYRGQLHRMGPINPEAPVELAATEERIEFLSQQVEDLTRTDEQLRTIISELDSLTSEAFAATVEKVNGIFDQAFRGLFGGGSGRLVMTDPDDLTTSGIDIIARLPNRREQGLALLSGGERSLTAAALIFALLTVAPPPFCVMDEVDAALDEANITRFRDMLRDLSRQIQFVLITHNRGTVQAAETIYGVSLQPDSSSQVISIKPEEYLKE
jgi:chromosome segregation protein